MTIERTLVLFKPDFMSLVAYSDDYLLQNTHEGLFTVLQMIGLNTVITKINTKLVKIYRNMPRDVAEQHYIEHLGKPFFEELVTFITTDKCYLVVLEGEEFLIYVGPKPEGGYDLDHICPCAQSNSEEELIKLQHYSNFQWLLEKENEIKSDKWTPKGEELCRKLLNREWIDKPSTYKEKIYA